MPCVMSVLCTHPHIKCHFTSVQLLHFEAETTWLFCAFSLHVVLVAYFYFYSLDREAVDLRILSRSWHFNYLHWHSLSDSSRAFTGYTSTDSWLRTDISSAFNCLYLRWHLPSSQCSHFKWDFLNLTPFPNYLHPLLHFETTVTWLHLDPVYVTRLWLCGTGNRSDYWCLCTVALKLYPN